MTAQHRASRKWGMVKEPPNRDPDFTVEAWITDGEIDWTHIFWPEGAFADFNHEQRVAALIDVAWTHASDPARVEHQDRPFLWIAIGNSQSTYLYERLEARASFAQLRWMLRRWWWVNLKLLQVFWAHARGPAR